jgi:hypothetical protein
MNRLVSCIAVKVLVKEKLFTEFTSENSGFGTVSVTQICDTNYKLIHCSASGFQIRITSMRIRIRILPFTLMRIRIQIFTSMRARILLLIKVIGICDHSTGPPGLHC